MDTDRVTTSTLRKRRLTALLLSTLVATSLLIATPSTQKPAYGLVEAGFVDAVGRYGRISVDGSGGGELYLEAGMLLLGTILVAEPMGYGTDHLVMVFRTLPR